MKSIFDIESMSADIRRRLDALAAEAFNYDANNVGSLTSENGWTYRSDHVLVGTESPGAARRDSVFAAAREVLASYRFVDPTLIHAFYDPHRPFVGRDLLLRVRPGVGHRLYFGARIVKVVEEEDATESRWGYSYRTLQSHVEMGEITFSVIKQHQSGRVDVRIDRYFKLGRCRNPFVWLGARVLLPMLQRRYIAYVLIRIPQMVSERVAHGLL